MKRDVQTLIATLVDDLAPVRPLRFGVGLGLALGALALTLVVVAVVRGFRSDILTGHIDPVFLLSTGLFLLLGLAAAVTAIVMASPRVGNSHRGWLWAAAMTALLPLTAAITAAATRDDPFAPEAAAHGLYCLGAGLVLGLATFSVLTVWLRRGAPMVPGHAGLLTGIAAGSLGIFAVSFQCPIDDIVHIGLWHSLVLQTSGMIGWLVVPRLIRW